MADRGDSSDGVREAAWAAVLVSALLIGQQVAGRALRDGFFLTHFPSSALPSVMTSASILSVAIVLGSARFLRGVAPARSLPVFFLGNAILFTLEWALSGPLPRAAAVILYLHTTSVGAVVVSGFWSVVNERFDPHTAKSLMGRIGTGASIGGVVGGLCAFGGAAVLDIPVLILLLGGLNALCVVGVRRIGGPRRPHPVEAGSGISAIEIFQETPYLRNLALLVGLAAFTGALYDYVFKAEAALRFTTGAELVSFFALFYLSLSIATLVLQNLLANRLLLGLGLAITVGTLPGAGIALGMLALLAPGLWTAGAMRAGIGVVENSLYRSGYELLYTPILPGKKRPTKTLVDVGGDKLGGAIGGAVAFFVLGIFPAAANPILLAFGVAAGMAALVVTRRLHHGYVSSLAESLRTGSIRADELDAVDSTTRETVAHTLVDMERSELLDKLAASGASESGLGRAELLERLRSGSVPGAESGNGRKPFVEPPWEPPAPSEIDRTVAAIVELRSGDPERVAAALRLHTPLPDALVGHVLPLLEDDALAVPAAEALARVAPAHTGVLLDAALQARTPLAIRRRVCDLLGGLPTQRCANGLVLLLGDEELEVRFRAAAALLRSVRSSPKLRIPREPLFEAAEAEARECARLWRYRTSIDARLTRSAPLESEHGRRVIQGISHVFTLLLAVLDAEPLRLAIRSLANPDPGERGTGLEYLDNVLPPGLREALWPLLVDTRLALRQVRPRSEILAEIVADGGLGPVDLAELRRRIDAQRRAPGPGSVA